MRLAMGAQGVCVGQPYLWGLRAFGQPRGVKVLENLHTEFRVAMMQCRGEVSEGVYASFCEEGLNRNPSSRRPCG